MIQPRYEPFQSNISFFMDVKNSLIEHEINQIASDQQLTNLEIAQIENEQATTDLEIAVAELQYN